MAQKEASDSLDELLRKTREDDEYAVDAAHRQLWQLLRDSAATLSTAHLRRIAQLADGNVVHRYYLEGDARYDVGRTYEDVDFSTVRELARAELERRNET
jgi:hypothetical protein